jgi:hypothetical protein
VGFCRQLHASEPASLLALQFRKRILQITRDLQSLLCLHFCFARGPKTLSFLTTCLDDDDDDDDDGIFSKKE